MPSSLTEDRSSTLGSLPLPTCVGVRYGSCGDIGPTCAGPLARGFSWRPGDHTTTRASAAPPVSPANGLAAQRPGFAWVSSPGPTPPPVQLGAGVLPVASPPLHPPHECRNLLPARHRLRPLTLRDLGLGSDSPWDDCRCPGTLRLPVWRVRHRHSRYSFRHSHLWALHPALAVRLHRCPQRSPTMARAAPGEPGAEPSAASGGCLSPVTLSAQGHSTSELLRTLSRMAASKPTSWLSAHPHHLCHSAAP